MRRHKTFKARFNASPYGVWICAAILVGCKLSRINKKKLKLTKNNAAFGECYSNAVESLIKDGFIDSNGKIEDVKLTIKGFDLAYEKIKGLIQR